MGPVGPAGYNDRTQPRPSAAQPRPLGLGPRPSTTRTSDLGPRPLSLGSLLPSATDACLGCRLSLGSCDRLPPGSASPSSRSTWPRPELPLSHASCQDSLSLMSPLASTANFLGSCFGCIIEQQSRGPVPLGPRPRPPSTCSASDFSLVLGPVPPWPRTCSASDLRPPELPLGRATFSLSSTFHRQEAPNTGSLHPRPSMKPIQGQTVP